jgi:hypothetical protein
MFETQVDFAQVHLLDPTTGAEILDSTQWSGYSEPLVPSIPDSFLLEPTIITETSDFSLDNNSNLIATDPLTGDSLTNTFLLPVVDDTLTTAQDLGTIEGTQTVSDSVGIDDLNDYYRINSIPKAILTSLLMV